MSPFCPPRPSSDRAGLLLPPGAFLSGARASGFKKSRPASGSDSPPLSERPALAPPPGVASAGGWRLLSALGAKGLLPPPAEMLANCARAARDRARAHEGVSCGAANRAGAASASGKPSGGARAVRGKSWAAACGGGTASSRSRRAEGGGQGGRERDWRVPGGPVGEGPVERVAEWPRCADAGVPLAKDREGGRESAEAGAQGPACGRGVARTGRDREGGSESAGASHERGGRERRRHVEPGVGGGGSGAGGVGPGRAGPGRAGSGRGGRHLARAWRVDLAVVLQHLLEVPASVLKF